MVSGRYGDEVVQDVVALVGQWTGAGSDRCIGGTKHFFRMDAVLSLRSEAKRCFGHRFSVPFDDLKKLMSQAKRCRDLNPIANRAVRGPTYKLRYNASTIQQQTHFLDVPCPLPVRQLS